MCSAKHVLQIVRPFAEGKPPMINGGFAFNQSTEIVRTAVDQNLPNQFMSYLGENSLSELLQGLQTLLAIITFRQE